MYAVFIFNALCESSHDTVYLVDDAHVPTPVSRRFQGCMAFHRSCLTACSDRPRSRHIASLVLGAAARLAPDQRHVRATDTMGRDCGCPYVHSATSWTCYTSELLLLLLVLVQCFRLFAFDASETRRTHSCGHANRHPNATFCGTGSDTSASGLASGATSATVAALARLVLVFPGLDLRSVSTAT